ncbi:hypothetical protein E4T44_11530, partial [Aureobasidium sp. EXF-8845]
YFQYGALASPARTPEQTPPELAASKPSSRGRAKHRELSAKIPLLPSFDTADSREANSAHAFDANRFTPTLHASLVSEILSLRRELDSKHQFIDNLEESLKTTNTENEDLSAQLRESNKKIKQSEQKFKLLENGTFDAVEGLLAERDNVKVANRELQNKLDAANKKTKSLEEEHSRSRDAWDKERISWMNDKRQLEQKVHITETRLRTVVEEVRTHHLASQVQQGSEDALDDDDDDVASIRTFRHTKHARNESSLSVRSLAPSIGSIRRPGMTSLANELNSDDEDYDTEEPEEDDVDLPLFAHNRSSINSRTSAISDRKAKKILGLTVISDSDTLPEGEAVRGPSIESLRTPSFAARFGLQMAKMSFSRSSSPARQKDETTSDVSQTLTVDQDGKIESSMVSTLMKPAEQGHQPRLPNLSTSDRLVEAPMSPPDTPHYVAIGDSHKEIPTKSIYQSASTQTDLAVAADLTSRRHAAMAAVEALPIPAITIQPPMSPRAGESVLPPGMRSSSTQTEKIGATPMADAGVQTEEIRIDRRPVKLPPHLLPSALEQGGSNAGRETQTTTSHRSGMHRSTFSKDGNRFPLKPLELPPPRLRSVAHEKRQQSEVDSPQDTPPARLEDTDPDGRLAESSDDMRAIFGNMPGLARPNVRSLFGGLPKTVPENQPISSANFVNSQERPSAFAHSKGMGSDGSSYQSRPPSSRDTSQSERTMPFFSSYERNSSRPNTASSYGVAPPPPFPIPGRMSSRPPTSEGPRSPTARETYSMRSHGSSKDSRIAPDGGLRKVQSSSTMRTNSLTPTHEGFGAPNGNSYTLDSPDFDQDSAVEEEEEKSQD